MNAETEIVEAKASRFKCKIDISYKLKVSIKYLC